MLSTVGKYIAPFVIATGLSSCAKGPESVGYILSIVRDGTTHAMMVVDDKDEVQCSAGLTALPTHFTKKHLPDPTQADKLTQIPVNPLWHAGSKVVKTDFGSSGIASFRTSYFGAAVMKVTLGDNTLKNLAKKDYQQALNSCHKFGQ